MKAAIYLKHLGKTAVKTSAPIIAGGLLSAKTGNSYYFLGGLAITGVSVPYYLLKLEGELKEDLDKYIRQRPEYIKTIV
ncbi:MAG: hypothetical protein KKB25_03450 [Nanoarchaeota archaeon]|nr:hypothetical protein [Nanoarchaeota archaeon]